MGKENLVFVVVDNASQFGAAPDEVTGGELAFEDRVLQVVAVTAHGLEDFTEAFVVADGWWTGHGVRADSKGFLEEQTRVMGMDTFRKEHLCEFVGRGWGGRQGAGGEHAGRRSAAAGMCEEKSKALATDENG